MKIDLSQIPEHALEAVRQIAAAQGEKLTTPEDVICYLHDDEEALELVLSYIETNL